MQNKRYIPILALQIENKLIPFWELEYHKSEDSGEFFKVAGDWQSHYGELTECVYDLKKKGIKPRKVKKIYPEKTEFQVGQTILREVRIQTSYHRGFVEDTIEEILFKEYETDFIPARKLKERLCTGFTEEEENSGEIFEIRRYKPHYKMKSGEIVKWEHQLAHKG